MHEGLRRRRVKEGTTPCSCGTATASECFVIMICRGGLGKRFGMRAALGPARVSQLRDLPGRADAHEHERVDPAVAERLVAMERVVRPHLGDVAVDADVGIEDALVPYVAGRCPGDGRAGSRREDAAARW